MNETELDKQDIRERKSMADSEEKEIVMRLNQQQLELVDRTIERSGAGTQSRERLFRLALQEFHADHSS